MNTYGLIGYPLAHSFSARYFAEKFADENIANCQYLNFPMKSIIEFPTLISNTHDLRGLNVTIPYKEQVMQYLNYIEATAKKIGAVNTIRIVRSDNNIELRGYNTDYYGFSASLLLNIKPIHKKALILGTGGASKAVQFALEEMGIACQFVSREPKTTRQLSYEDVNRKVIESHLIIVNTTPLGTFPNTETFPQLQYEALTEKHILYDLVYNPPESKFLQLGKKYKAICINGLKMLHLQAEKAWEIWNC